MQCKNKAPFRIGSIRSKLTKQVRQTLTVSFLTNPHQFYLYTFMIQYFPAPKEESQQTRQRTLMCDVMFIMIHWWCYLIYVQIMGPTCGKQTKPDKKKKARQKCIDKTRTEQNQQYTRLAYCQQIVVKVITWPADDGGQSYPYSSALGSGAPLPCRLSMRQTSQRLHPAKMDLKTQRAHQRGTAARLAHANRHKASPGYEAEDLSTWSQASAILADLMYAEKVGRFLSNCKTSFLKREGC